jgi:16S rRNA (cytidine1402-2'-O)-methyltransferase
MTTNNALYIVATPIGNLSDITLRAIDTLKGVDFIAAEDTRHSAKLMQHFDIKTPMLTYHDHGGQQQGARMLSLLNEGKNLALISDAGTPLISDPGYRLVKQAREAGIKVVPIPGASALITAISAAGLASDRFSFEGFPPAKTSARVSYFTALAEDTRTLVFYESPHRIWDSLQAMQRAFGAQRQAVLARELTKNYETFLSGSLADLIEALLADENHKRGEMVIMLEGFSPPSGEETVSSETAHVLKTLMQELPLKQATALAAKITGEKKNKLYQWALSQQSG